MFQKSLTATAKVSLGMPATGVVGCVVFQIVDLGSWSGSAVVKIRVGGVIPGTQAPIPDAELKTVPYVNVATKTLEDAATAITAEGIYAVEAPGLEVVLDYTHTAGSAAVYGAPLDDPLQLINVTAAA